MTCCNLCFQVNLGLPNICQPQGHTFCGVPTAAQVAAYAYGERPEFQDNRWTGPQEAIPAVIKDNEQVWMFNGDYFVVRNGEMVAMSVPY